MLLVLPLMNEDDVWRWQPPIEEPGSRLVPSNGVGGHVAHRTWRGDSSLTLFQYSASHRARREWGEAYNACVNLRLKARVRLIQANPYVQFLYIHYKNVVGRVGPHIVGQTYGIRETTVANVDRPLKGRG